MFENRGGAVKENDEDGGGWGSYLKQGGQEGNLSRQVIIKLRPGGRKGESGIQKARGRAITAEDWHSHSPQAGSVSEAEGRQQEVMLPR